MAKQLNVNLAFTAQTGQAKAQIQELQSLLYKVASNGNTNIKVNAAGIREAAAAAKQLQYHLNNAYNSTTGNFDLSRFHKSLSAANTSVGALSSQLLKAGTTGQQAFAALAQSISKADQPMLRLGTRMNEFMTTLKNTARWQISSSILHGFMGTIQSAYRYAQDLNESLNNIRIVAGQSVDQMAAFADQANKAAKALSTTTTEYTNASLIYYQQGLNDAQVKERTDATIKMANVSRQSAETVSDQMTAIWNNFDDGSKSLEYYGDVITALGAKTASSSQEIAAGLEKFAAVSETIGLSYEYATSALATVTATTRQSADVVGTAFKTIFTRLQGLQLGDTLEDGVTLNKYSEALAKVGVNAVDANGNLVEMDTILDQLGSRWDTLSEAEQTALAQTVAGVRQYTQLIALMDNWDFFKENLNIAYDSEGTLTEQAKIYEESWEAAAKRVKASAETIYASLLDDKFFIGMNNGFAKILGGIGEFIKGIGGLKGAFVALGSVVLNNFVNKIPQAVENLKHNFAVLTKGSIAAYQNINAQMQQVANQAFVGKNGIPAIDRGSSLGYSITSANELAVARSKLAAVTDQMTTSERQLKEAELAVIEAQQRNLLLTKQENEEEFKKLAARTSSNLLAQHQPRMSQISSEIGLGKGEADALLQDILAESGRIRSSVSEAIISGVREGSMNGAKDFTINFSSVLQPLKGSLEGAIGNVTNTNLEKTKNTIRAMIEELPQAVREASNLQNVLNNLGNVKNAKGLKDLFKSSNIQYEAKIVVQSLKEIKAIAADVFGEGTPEFYRFTGSLSQIEKKARDAANGVSALSSSVKTFNPAPAVNGLQAIGAAGALLGNFSMALMSVKSSYEALSNPDTSGIEKLTSVLMSLGMMIPAITSSFKNIGMVFTYFTTGVKTSTMALMEEKAALISKTSAATIDGVITKKQTAQEILKAAGIDANTMSLQENSKETLAHALVTQLDSGATLTEAINTLFENGVISKNTKEKLLNVAATKALTAARLIGVVGIAAAAITLGILIAKRKEEIAATEEAASKAREEAASKKELISSNEDIINSYEEALNAYKEVQAAQLEGTATTEELASAQDTLQEKALEVAKALGLEGTALAKLSGNYDQLTEDIIKAQNEQLDEAKQSEIIAQGLTGQEFVDDMLSKTGNYLFDDDGNISRYIARFGTGFLSTDEMDLSNIFTDKNYKYLDYNATGDRSILLSSGQDSIQMIAAYEEAQDLYNEMLNNFDSAELAKSEVFQNLQDYLAKSQESYEAYKASEEQIQEYSIKIEANKILSNITDYQSYKKQSDNLIKNIAEQRGISEGTKEWDELTQAVHAYLGSLAQIEEYHNISLGLDEAEKQIKGIDDLRGYYESLSDEEKEIFFQIKFNAIEGEYELRKALKYYQSVADLNAIQVKIEFIKEAQDMIGNDEITLSEWASWGTQMEEMLAEVGESFDIVEFLTLSEDEQRAFLTKYEDLFDQIENSTRDKTIAQANARMAELETEYENSFTPELIADRKLSYLKDYQEISSIGADKRTDEQWETMINASTKLEGLGYNVDSLANTEFIEAEITAIEAEIEAYNALQEEYESTKQTKATLENEKELEESLGWLEELKQEINDLGLDYSTVENLAEQIMTTAAASDELADNLINDKRAALEVAKGMARYDKAVKSISSNYDKWIKTLKKGSMYDQAEAIDEITEAYADLLNLTDKESLSAEFALSAKNMEKFKKAAAGDKNSYNQLQIEAAKDMLKDYNLQLDDTIETIANAEGIEVGDIISINDIDTSALAGQLNNLFNSAYNAALAGGASVADAMQIAQNAINAVGFEMPDIEMEEKTVFINGELPPSLVPLPGGAYSNKDVAAQGLTWTSEPSGEYQTAIRMMVPSGTQTNFRKTSETLGGGSAPTGGGGGGGKTPERKRLSSDDRYKEINDKIDNLTETMKDYNRELDTAYGMGRVAAMDKILTKMEDEQDLLRDRIDLAKEYQDIDAKNLQKTMAGKADVEYDSFADFGVADFTIDAETGDITNWTSVWTDFRAKRDALMDELLGENGWEKAAIGARKTELEEQIAKMDEFEEKVREDAEQYMETVEQREEWEQELKDKIIEEMEMRFDKWEASLDYMEEINNEALNQLEKTLDHFSDNFFARAEKLTIMSGVSDIYNVADAGEWLNKYNDLNDQHNAVDEDGNPLITDADYVEGMKHIAEYASGAIDEIYNFMDDLSTYYADTIDQSLDMLDGVNEQFEHIQTILDHYANIYEIIAGTSDYDTQLKILETRRDNLIEQANLWGQAYKMYSEGIEEQRQEYETAEDNFEDAKGDYLQAKQKYDNAKKNYDDTVASGQSADEAKKNLDEAEKKLKEAETNYNFASKLYTEAEESYKAQLAAAQGSEEKMLEVAAEYAQTIKDIFAKEVEKYGEEMERVSLSVLDGVYSFDQLNEEIEYAKSLTEDWLTETNKIYETNKLINKAQSDLDKTTNALAKKKLKSFMDETEQLQNQAKLSNFELEVQEAKYNLLLAEIALEEAQNAKSVVRMQRDSEGNYGYVYTADNEAIGEAEQAYADAENELYNIRLEGANEFAEKRLQAEQDYQEKLAELWKAYRYDQTITEEEFNARKAELQKSHYDLITGYAHIYGEAVRYDTRVTADAWSTDYADMVTDTETWKKYTDEYLKAVEGSFTTYQQNVDGLLTLLNGALGTNADNINELLVKALDNAKTATNNLKDAIGDETGGLIKAMDDQIDKVADLVKSYTNLEDGLIPTLQTAIDKYKELYGWATKDWTKEAGDGKNNTDDIKPGGGGDGDNPPPPADNPEDETGNGDKPTYTGLGTTEEETPKENSYEKWASDVYFGANKVSGKSGFATEEEAKNYRHGVVGTVSVKKSGDGSWEYRIWYNDKIVSAQNGYATQEEAYAAGNANRYPTVKIYSYSSGPIGKGGVATQSRFDTGGYTGSWGPEGRLAMLHQKELVLNANDTENMLQAISLVRDIIQHIDLSAAVASTRGGFSLNALNDTTTALEQQVSIEANFPNVQDRYEIEAAFNNLINTASQFANRKKL